MGADPIGPDIHLRGVFRPRYRLARQFQHTFRIRIGQPVAAQLQFQPLGVELVKIAIAAAVGQRMFQQGQQGFGIQLAQEQIAHVTQEPTRRRQMQRQARAVVGQDVPPVQRRGHLTR